jgi:hypothetical protein
MEWLNLHSSVLHSPEAVGEDPVNRATWVWLLAYCATQENGGRIAGCAAWGDRRWQQSCQVTLEEVRRESLLWRWDGDDLVLRHYPQWKEDEIRAMRQGGREGNLRRWKSGRIAPRKDEVDRPPNRDPISPPDSLPESPPVSRREGKEVEGKEVEGNKKGTRRDGECALTRTVSPRFRVPSRDELDLYAAKLGLPAPEVDKFVAYYESNGWRVGRNPMRSWHGALAGWKTRWEEGRYHGNTQHGGRAGHDRNAGTLNETIQDGTYRLPTEG